MKRWAQAFAKRQKPRQVARYPKRCDECDAELQAVKGGLECPTHGLRLFTVPAWFEASESGGLQIRKLPRYEPVRRET
jgi:hypothetical protein